MTAATVPLPNEDAVPPSDGTAGLSTHRLTRASMEDLICAQVTEMALSEVIVTLQVSA